MNIFKVVVMKWLKIFHNKIITCIKDYKVEEFLMKSKLKVLIPQPKQSLGSTLLKTCVIPNIKKNIKEKY